MRKLGLVLLLSCCAASLSAQNITSDISTGTEIHISDPQQFTTIGSTTYFVAQTENAGFELWKTDGTGGGTSMVIELDPGASGSSTPTYSLLGGLGSNLLFLAYLPGSGTSLWSSDGTAGGTTLVTTMPGVSFSYRPTLKVNGKLYPLLLNTSTFKNDLWCTDGTAGGTVALSGGVGIDDVFDAYAFGNNVVFFGATAAAGYEPWITDGTVGGTSMITDLNTGAGNSVLAPTATGGVSGTAGKEYNGEFFFMGNNGTSGYELWKTDGTAGGTGIVLDINTGAGDSSASGFEVHGGELFFSAIDSNGRELWKSDGTAGGTQLVRNINASGDSSPALLTSTAAGLVFSADDGTTGREPWISDGTTGGTVLLKDIASGGASQPSAFEVHGSNVYFFAFDTTVFLQKVFVSDGTTGGTVQVGGAYVTPSSTSYFNLLESDGTRVYFSNGEPWSITGNTAQLLSNIAPDVESVAFTSGLPPVALSGNLIFRGRASGANWEPWISDGTGGGTSQLLDIVAGTSGSDPYSLRQMGSYVFFTAYSTANGHELWRTDGTAGGTIRLTDLKAGSASSYARPFGVMGGSMRFWAISSGGIVLGSSDGTVAGTSTFSLPSTVSNIHNIGISGNRIYFTAEISVSSFELWVSDGTQSGTGMISTVFTQSYDPEMSLFEFGGETYFIGIDFSSTAIELWKTDGTVSGTGILKDINPGLSYGIHSDHLRIGSVNGALLFTADNGSTGMELWKSDGTTAGTNLLLDINSGVLGSTPAEFTPFNGQLFFSAETAANGRELWVTDGTVGGTTLFKDIYAGMLSSNPNNLHVWNGLLYFAAADASGGMELWSSDGTSAGTQRVADLLSGTGSSAPAQFVSAGTRLFFNAYTPTTGREWWVLDSTNSAPTILPAGAIFVTAGTTAAATAVATVADAQDTPGSLTVAAISVPTGLSVTNITNTSGIVTADVSVSTAASNGANVITFQVTDSGTLTATAQFTVNVSGATNGGGGSSGGGGGGGGGCAASSRPTPSGYLALLVGVLALIVYRHVRRVT